jgi:PAS domain S-box-containing protein
VHASGEQPLQLSDFLQQDQDEILRFWERALRSAAEPQPLSQAALRDHVPELLSRIADVVRTGDDSRPAPLGDLADQHALDRLATGFDLREVAGELALLRDVALQLWEPHAAGRDAAAVVEEIRHLDRAVDDVMARSVDRYARSRERTLSALDRVSSVALGTRDLDTLLQRLLNVLLEATATADSAFLLLRDDDGDVFRVRAAAGALVERGIDFSVRTGEGFAGEVALRREPLLVHDASSDPLVLNPALRGERIHALYGIPLVHDDEVVGVAKLASRTAYDFPDDDKRLFLAMGQRATAIIAESQLVTRERDALAAVSRSESELRHLMIASPDMLAVVGADGLMRRVNPAASAVLGYSEKELLTTSCLDFIHPDDRARVIAEIGATLAGTPSRKFVFRFLRKDGAVRWISCNASGEPGADTFVAAGRDVTEERERSELEQQLIGIVSHDLRTPLSTILTSSTLLVRRAEALDARMREDCARRIHSAAERASALIRDLLDFTRARTAGGIAIAPRSLDLHALARGVAEDVRATHPGRAIAVEQAGDGWGFWDPARISQLLENLVSNAFKYGDPSAPVAVRTVGGERWVRLEIHNRGRPIDPGLLPHLFEPLRQGKRTGVVGGVAGVGLGLYIVDHIVRAHRGTIEVHSTAAEGTTFIVRLPREPPD